MKQKSVFLRHFQKRCDALSGTGRNQSNFSTLQAEGWVWLLEREGHTAQQRPGICEEPLSSELPRRSPRAALVPWAAYSAVS